MRPHFAGDINSFPLENSTSIAIVYINRTPKKFRITCIHFRICFVVFLSDLNQFTCSFSTCSRHVRITATGTDQQTTGIALNTLWQNKITSMDIKTNGLMITSRQTATIITVSTATLIHTFKSLIRIIEVGTTSCVTDRNDCAMTARTS